MPEPAASNIIFDSDMEQSNQIVLVEKRKGLRKRRELIASSFRPSASNRIRDHLTDPAVVSSRRQPSPVPMLERGESGYEDIRVIRSSSFNTARENGARCRRRSVRRGKSENSALSPNLNLPTFQRARVYVERAFCPMMAKMRRGIIAPMTHVPMAPASIHRVQEEKAMAAVPQYPIETSKFASYVEERKKKRILLKGELMMIKKSLEHHKSEYASMKENAGRNDYPDILPYDFNRVMLSTLPADPSSHYINASYIDSFYQPKAYVVTQGVRTKRTCTAFYRMIWELNSNCIVMLTKVFDFMKVVCLQYWPLVPTNFDDIRVETLDTKVYAFFVLRTLKLTKTNNGKEETRIIRHFHFTEWEANSLPYSSAFLDFRTRIRKHTSENPCDGPMIVHCSNGAGRCGVFLAVDANLELAREENIIDVYGYCKALVNARPNLVENMDQYTFIYEAVSEAVQCDAKPFPMEELKTRGSLYLTKKSRQQMEAQYSEEFKLLCQLTPSLRIGDCAGGHRLENRGKNRDVMVVPPDYARPYLSTLHGESKDYTYINAVFCDGFTRKNEWVVSEWPKQNTIDSFWALIFDHNCQTVVNLCNQGNPKQYPPFIHTKGRQAYGPFVVDIINCDTYPTMTSHVVKIMKRTFMLTELLMSGKGTNSLEVEHRTCNIVSVRIWPIQNRVPLSTAGLIDLIKLVRSWRRRTDRSDRPETKPTVVISHNGISRCGVFVAANIIIDQMDLDSEVDVFHASKLVRLNRPQLVENKDEYKYLYDLVLHYYLTSIETKDKDGNKDRSPYPGQHGQSPDGPSASELSLNGAQVGNHGDER